MHTIYVFDHFELDRARFELRREGVRVAIQPKELRLLFYLVAHRGRVLSNEELFAALWPTVTVCRGSLKRAVRGVRRALGDDGERQSRIRTVRGYGYCFVAPELADSQVLNGRLEPIVNVHSASNAPPL